MGDNELVIVAIPREDDYVWQLSSEKVPHMTLLYLGEQSPEVTAQIVSFVEHAVASSLYRFSTSVERRGPLGPEDADVLFFRKVDSLRAIAEFRDELLQNDAIKTAYLSQDQYPTWTPHLTMGYPTAPAKKDTRDYPGISYVDFEQIAVWTGDYTGPTFDLKDQYFEEVRMSDAVNEHLAHYGIKGMKWGVRRAEIPRGSTPTLKTKNTKIKNVTLSKSQHAQDKPHADAKKAAVLRKRATSKSTDALSNKELKDLVERMNLEQQYSRLKLTDPNRKARPQDFIKKTLEKGRLANEVVSFVNSPAGKLLRQNLKK